MTIWITSGGRPSNGRLALQKAAGFRKVKEHSQFKISDTLINWGCSGGLVGQISILNHAPAVALAANKLSAFKRWQVDEVSCVPWTTNTTTVKEWLDKYHVVARTKLTGHSGDGIIIIEPKSDDLPEAPLYTRYIMKTHEYRLHVVGKHVVDIQRKIRDPDREPTDWKVRSHQNGFIFARNNVQVSDELKTLAIRAVGSLGLDFGAVDIVVDKGGIGYVLEVNTAPGLEGQTIQNYATALKELAGGG